MTNRFVKRKEARGRERYLLAPEREAVLASRAVVYISARKESEKEKSKPEGERQSVKDDASSRPLVELFIPASLVGPEGIFTHFKAKWMQTSRGLKGGTFFISGEE